jgi:aspartokinase-like uncharacterized kinase
VTGAPRALPCIVAKLGGSLAGDAALPRCLAALAQPGPARIVVTPGGGPFADVVRAAQDRWRFSDHVAHVMAIEAMDQFGRLLCAIEARAAPCSTLPDIETAWADRLLPVWLPSRMMRADAGLPRTWDVTSDTIAAWLARALGAHGLLLVKSCHLPAGVDDPAVLAAAGIVDRELPGFLSRTGLRLHVVHKDRWIEFRHVITGLAGQG